MTNHRAGSPAILCFAFLAVSALQAQSPGHVNFSSRNYPTFDTYTRSPSSATQQWLQSHFMRMAVYSPYFDSRTSWFSGAQVYDDLFAIALTSQLRFDHPEWIMRDQSGNWLYVNFDCAGGSCPQYAGDISNPAFRDWWIANARAIVSRGHYSAMWMDDVDINFSVSDGWGNPVAPMDSNTGRPMIWDAWRGYIAQFTEQIRAALPNVELLENSVWFAGPDGVRDADQSVRRQIATASNINVERGITDPGLTGGTGVWSVHALLAYIDRVHDLGPSVTLDHYDLSPDAQRYALAGYYLISNGKDRYGDDTTNPDNWWSGFNTELGDALGPRTYTNGVFQRNFTGGMVLVGEPGLSPQTVDVHGIYTTLDGSVVTSVTVGSAQGVILLGTNSSGPSKTPSAPGPQSPGAGTQYVSDLNPTYMTNGWGPLQTDKSTYGNTLTLNGVQYPKGLGVHAYSEVHYALNGACSSLSAMVGIDDEIPAGLGSVGFQVWGDGYKLFDSGTRTGRDPALPVSVNVTGVQNLSLTVTNGIYLAPSWLVPCDHGDWANATIQCTH